MAHKTAPDIDPELYKLTALCSQIALTCATLTLKLTQGPAAGLCDKRLAYHSAVRIAETGEAFNHRALYNRLYHITVAGETDRRTAFDGGAAQHAADAYESLLSNDGRDARYKTNRQIQTTSIPSPALDAVLAYQDASVEGPLTASQEAMQVLLKGGWLPSPRPPLAWRSSLRAIQAKTLVPMLRDMSDALDQALTIVIAVETFVKAAEGHTRGFRQGSAVKRLLPVLACDPVVTQERVVTAGLMSNVAFQKGIKELEALGVCAELTKRKRHRAWVAALAIVPKFEGLVISVFSGPETGEPKQRLQNEAGNKVEQTTFEEMENALTNLEKLIH